MDRRRFLLTAGASATVGLAGCGGTGGPGDGPGGSGNDSGGTGGGPSAGAGSNWETIEEHPAATDLAAQPHLGDLDGHVVLAFEDPACPNCGRFHEQTLPKVRENVVDPGEGAFVLRTFPVLPYDWNDPAAKSLEATFDRNADAVWDLLAHYYAEQGAFGSENVLDRTATFLGEETDLDGRAVVEAVRAGEYDDAVQADLDAAENGDVGRATPTVLLFRDGEYATTVTGAVDYDVIAGTLGV